MAWPSFDPLATWPAPGALTDVEKASPEKRPDPRDVEDLLWAARLVVRKSWLPEEPQKSLAVDDRGRLFLKLQQGSETGLASMHMYRGSGLPHTPFAMVVRSAQPDPSTVGELRERVGRYVDPNLAQELQGGESQLHAHPRYPFAANAYLSPSGPSQMGLHFQVIHAYAHGATL